MIARQKLDRYTVLRKLAAGGMGEVFVARQEGMAGFEKLVVLKTLKPELAARDGFREMFFEEARVAAMARHGNVVSVLDVGVAGDTHFIVMEYIEGWSLREILDAQIRAGSPLPLRYLLPVAIDMATGLGHVHGLRDSRGQALELVHRDVSPENVMITVDGLSKLVDFGIAKRQDSPIETAPGLLKGKARYLSPEQVRGGRLGPATDQFALGSVIFEMATGEPLFAGESTPAVVFAMGSGEIRDPADVRPDLPEELHAVLRRALAKEPEERYKSCNALAGELARLQDTCDARASRPQLIAFLQELVPKSPVQELQLPSRELGAAATAVHQAGHEIDDISTRTLTPTSDKTAVGSPAIDLIGRNRELDRIRDSFAAGIRAITLLGPGGVGKTSIARHHAYLARYERGQRESYFIDLTEARSDIDIASQLASTLELELLSDSSWDESIARVGLALAGRGPTLLVIDNVEQVIDPVAQAVARWLELAPHTRLLITSREPLGLTGELRLDVEPLERGEAIDLLCHRIRAVRPKWRAKSSDRKIAGDIVDRLDRLPLAIELAAARGGVLSMGQLYRRLSEGLGWLRSRRRDLSGRHASLADTIAWSWRLLEGWERNALGQCAVFRGGFTLLDAEAVIRLGSARSAEPDAPSGHLEAGDVIDAVQSLREKSLLYSDVAAGLADDEPRFRMYESIRDFAHDQMAQLDAAAAEKARARHMDYFLALAEELASGIDGPQGTRCLDRMASSLDNFSAALDTASERSAAKAARLAVAIERLLAARGPAPLHDTWLDTGLRAVDRGGTAEDKVRLLCALGNALITRGDHNRASASLAVAIDLAESLGQDPLIAAAYEAMGFNHLRRRELDRAKPCYRRAHDLYRAAGDRDGEARVMGKLALYHQRCGNHDLAGESYDLAIALHEMTGNLRAAGQLYGRRGLLRLELGHLDRARGDLQRAIGIARQWGDLTRESSDICNLGLLEMEAGNREDARSRLQAALTIDIRQGNRPSQSIALINLGVLALDSGDLGTARERLQQALAIAREVEYHHLELMAIGNLGIAAQAAGQLERAVELFEKSRAMQQKHPSSWVSPTVFIAHLAAVQAERGELDAALASFEEARQRAREGRVEIYQAVIECLTAFCDIARARSATSPSARAQHLEAARAQLSPSVPPSCDLRIARAILARALALAESEHDHELKTPPEANPAPRPEPTAGIPTLPERKAPRDLGHTD